MKEAARADDAGLRDVVKLVGRIVSGKEPGLAGGSVIASDGLTMKKLAELWTAPTSRSQVPRPRPGEEDQRQRRERIEWLGKVRMADGRRSGPPRRRGDARRLLLRDANLPKTAEPPASRRQYAQSLRRPLLHAVYPCWASPTLPIPKGSAPHANPTANRRRDPPGRGSRPHRRTSAASPLARRLFFGLLVREGLRS